eukprot:1491650-Rhodomonas_salina.3
MKGKSWSVLMLASSDNLPPKPSPAHTHTLAPSLLSPSSCQPFISPESIFLCNGTGRLQKGKEWVYPSRGLRGKASPAHGRRAQSDPRGGGARSRPYHPTRVLLALSSSMSVRCYKTPSGFSCPATARSALTSGNGTGPVLRSGEEVADATAKHETAGMIAAEVAS